ncbi:MAG TPA: AMP-binding protein [Ilumatobacteraceae bacterium]|nr:AMP-binding protein [Ilumatobacteraceae bacterium]
MARLVAIDLPGGSQFVDALRRTWDDGDAAFPLDRRLPPRARQGMLDAIAPDRLIDSDGTHHLSGRGVDDGDALVVATSGTTGAPRGVVLTHAAVEASAEATSARLGVSADDVWLACLPLSHVGGLSVVTRALATSTPLVVQDGFDAEAVTAAARRGATLVSLVSTALRRIDPGLFRQIVLGGSRPPDELPDNVVATYGLTETGSGVVYDGRPLDGVEIRVDTNGEIHLRCPMLLRCYRDGTSPLIDGWFPTGDLGLLDDSGTLTVFGRRGDMIVTGGENVWPAAVEAVLSTHPAVAAIAVAGEPDVEWGQRIVAWIVAADPSDPPTLASIRSMAAESLPMYMAPKEIRLVESLPTTSSGKVRRHDLPTSTTKVATDAEQSFGRHSDVGRSGPG